MRLDRHYFSNPTLDVAQDLLGKVLHFKNHAGFITETEAYIGLDDPACHAACGKTARNAAMFGMPGSSYVYMIYGIYFCLNIVTEKMDFPAAVLIRGLTLFAPDHKILDGPGKLCKQLAITKEHNGLDLTTSTDFYIENQGYSPNFVVTPRIGIKVGKEKLWRFLVK